MSDLQPSVSVSGQGSVADSHIPERRKRIYHAIDELVEKRQQTLISYSRLAALDELDDIENLRADLRAFCQALLDYAALEQFEIFDAYSSHNERREQLRILAHRHYPPLSEMNEKLVAFNDKYEGNGNGNGNGHVSSIGELTDDLYAIGDLLSRRVEEEDRFIQSMLKS